MTDFYLFSQESRVLKFWFSENTDYLDKVTGAYEFFKELVKPDEFPRGNYLCSFEIHNYR